MLKITVHQSPGKSCFQLEGKLTGPWVEELCRVWQSVASSPDSRELQIDLREVSFADHNGRDLLRQIYQRSGAIFLADSPLTQHFADEASRKS